MQNRRVVLASRPAGWVTESNFRIESAPFPSPAEGEILVKNLWLSLDPYMRGRMSEAKSYVKGVDIGEVMVGQTVGEVVESKDSRFKPGDKVLTQVGWQLFGCTKEAFKVDGTKIPLSYYLGVLGMPGMTAYFGLKELGQPNTGETVVVSAASGAVGQVVGQIAMIMGCRAVGSVVGQLAKIWGCRAVGIAGGPEKCAYVTHELGFDACVDYKAGNLHRDLKAACAKGVDVYFENVGGEILDTLLRQMNLRSRIVVCGLIAEYNATEPYGYKNLRAVLVNRIRIQGMIVFDWQDRYAEALASLGGYLREGRLKTRESVVQGLENAPQGLISLLKGGNFGKQLVKLS